MKHTNCVDCRICDSIDYSRMRHAHADEFTCMEAGYIGHPPWGGPGTPAYDSWKAYRDLMKGLTKED